MPNLLAISMEGEIAPSFDLHCLEAGRTPPDGWGIGYYPAGEPSGSVLKEPAPRSGSIRNELVKAWEHLASSVFVLHIRRATWGANTDANTQPFLRTWGGRDWLFGHAGSLRHRIEVAPGRPFEPVGSTDTELVFCELLSRISERGWRSLGDVDLPTLQEWLAEFDDEGGLCIVLTDGHDLCAYSDRDREGSLHVAEFLPPHEVLRFGDDDLDVDLTRRGIKSRKGVVVTSTALESHTESPLEWRELAPGTLLVLRQGAVRAELAPLRVEPSKASQPAPAPRPVEAPVRQLVVRHRTTYHYETAVERSSHVLRLAPVHDRFQNVLSHELSISVDADWRDYEDVFGNRARRVRIETPYTKLVIEAKSRVELCDTVPLNLRPLHARSTIPLVWMPWQRHMLTPYLLPPELPESQLRELVEYAESFVKRNDFDLLDTLIDINTTIFREYRYKQGSTTLYTTAFDVYANRRGVCQDFTNLFICLARLLSVPARYTCGYLYTGPQNPNQVQSEASHAWVQLYLPEVGWRGFDPTNGLLTQTDHVRVAVGRNYVDATPTSGTLWVGGAKETLSVDVQVELIE